MTSHHIPGGTMMRANLSKPVSVLTAVLFLTIGLGAIVPSVGAVETGGGVDVSFDAGGGPLSDGSSVWLADGDSTLTVTTIVDDTAGSQDINFVSFGLENPDVDMAAQVFTWTPQASDPDGWGAATQDVNDDGTNDGAEWERPADAPGCDIVPEAPCEEMSSPSRFPVSMTLNDDGGMPADFDAALFVAGWAGDNGIITNFPEIYIGKDWTAPVIAASFDDGTGSSDQNLYHNEDRTAMTVRFTTSDATSGLSSFTISGAATQDCLGASTPPVFGTTIHCDIDLTGFADGVYTFNADAEDAAGNNAVPVSITVKLDGGKPTTTSITGAPDASWTNSVPAAITLAATDDHAGVAGVEFSWSGAHAQAESTISGAGPFAVTPSTIGEGEGTLTYTIFDAAHTRNEHEGTFDLWVDTIAPAIDVFNFQGGTIPGGFNGAYTDISDLEAAFAVSDATSGIASVEYSLDGTTFSPATSPIDLSGVGEGAQTLTLRVTDNAGNVETDTISFDVDTVAPVISSVVLAGPDVDGLAKAGETVTLTFDVSEAVTPAVQMTINGAPENHDSLSLSGSTYTATYAVQVGDNGPIGFTIDATDLAGNVATQQSAGGVTADTVAPATALTIDPAAPDNMATGFYTSTPTVTLSCDDGTGSGCAETFYEIGSDGVQTYTASFAVRDGEDLDVTYWSVDAAGNAETVNTDQYDIDATPPTATIDIASSQGNGLAKAGDTVTVTFTPSEEVAVDTATIVGQGVALPGNVQAGLAHEFTYVVQVGDDGAATFSVTFTDLAGNEVTDTDADTGAVTIDTSAPVGPTITAGFAPQGDNSYYTDITGLDALITGEPGTIQHHLDGTFVDGASVDLSELPEGDSLLTARVVDDAGNAGAETALPLKVDQVSPAIMDLLVSGTTSGSSTFTAPDVTVTYTASDATSGLAAQAYSLNGGAFAPITSGDVLSPGDGTHSITVRLTDHAGLTTSDSTTFSIDTNAPAAPTINLIGGTAGDGGYYTAVDDLVADVSSAEGTIEYDLDGAGFVEYAGQVDLSGLADGVHSFEARVTDSAGNIGGIATVNFDIDTTAPSFDTLALHGGTLGNGGTYTDATGLEAAFTTSDATSGVAADEYSLDGINFQTATSPIDLSGLSDGSHTLTLRVTDVAGLQAIESLSLEIDTMAPTLDLVSIVSSGEFSGTANEATVDDVITLSWTGSEDLANVAVTIQGTSVTPDGNEASYTVTGDDEEGGVAFTVDFEDLAGNVGTQVVATTDGSAVAINFGDLVATTVTSVGDAFMQTGDSTTITTTTLWDEDPNGVPDSGIDQGDAYAFGRIAIFVDGVVEQTKTANSQGVASFTVTHNEAEAVDYTFKAIGFAPNPDRVVTEHGDVLARTQTVSYTELVASGFSVTDDVLSKGADATFQVTLMWAHDGSPATGLEVDGFFLDALGQGSGNDPRDLVPDTPESGSVAAFTETATPGLYETTYGHGAYESLQFSLAGGPLVADPMGDATNFDVPSATSLYVHWIGAYVSDVSLENQDDASDPTPEFVNLDDSVVPTATVVYTPNYDPNGVNGLLAGGTDSALVEGAQVDLFLTTYTDGSFVEQSHNHAANADSDSDALTGATGEATLPALHKGNLQADGIRGGANVYGLRYFATAVPGIDEQTIDATNAGDLDFENTLTLTALDLVYVADTEENTGVSDFDGNTAAAGESVAAGDRWWLGMDNAKGDADTDPSDDDALSIDVQVIWRHDGTPVDAADVKIHDGSAFLGADGVDRVETTSLGAIDGYTIDPDDYGLDALIQTLEFQAVSAPEPGGLGTIDQPHDTFTQEMLWTRVALLMDFESLSGDSDGELDLGASTTMYFVPVYYHDENAWGRPYYFTPDYDGEADGVFDFVGDVLYDATLDDATASGLTTAPQQLEAGSGLKQFTVFGGCTDITDATTCASTKEILEAGWHTYTAGMSVTPHDLPVDPASLDVLYTAVVIDAQTNRLTAPVGTAIDVTAQAFYAHTKDVEGVDLPDVGFGLGNKPYTNGVLADLTVDGTPLASYDDVAFDAAGAFAGTVPSPAMAAHQDLLVVGVQLDDDGSALPLTLVSDSASMERVWLAADTAEDPGRDGFTDRNLQVRGRDVVVFFDVAYTDGDATTTVSDTNFGYDFTPEDDNAADRFDRTTGAGTAVSTAPNADPATAEVFAVLGGTTFPASFVTGEGGCTDGCWKATIGGYNEVAADVSFGLGAEIPLTLNQTDTDIGTTVSISEPDQFEVDFTAIELTVVSDGNTFYQDDLDEFWYNLGTDGTFEVQATWGHTGDAAKGANIGVDGFLGATVTDVNDDGTYDVTIDAADVPASDRVTYDLAVSSIPSLGAGEADLTDATPFTIDEDSLTLALAQPTLVHTQAVLAWADDYDGGFTNKGQSAKFSFMTTWEHDGTVIDVDHGWELLADGNQFLSGVPGGVGGGLFDVTVTGSTAVTLAPELVVDPNQSPAPRGINAEVLPATAPEVTWTAILVDVDDDLSTHTPTAPATENVAARAGLEHDPLAYLNDIQLKLVGTAQTTAPGGYTPDGGSGANVDLRVLAPASVDVHGEGISYTPAKLLPGASAITASVDDKETLTFQ